MGLGGWDRVVRPVAACVVVLGWWSGAPKAAPSLGQQRMAADTAALVHALQHTLSPDKETRVQAEAALAEVVQLPALQPRSGRTLVSHVTRLSIVRSRRHLVSWRNF